MGVKLRRDRDPPEFVIQLDDDMSFALVDLLLQSLVHWAALPTKVRARLGTWAREVREIKDGRQSAFAEDKDA